MKALSEASAPPGSQIYFAHAKQKRAGARVHAALRSGGGGGGGCNQRHLMLQLVSLCSPPPPSSSSSSSSSLT